MMAKCLRYECEVCFKLSSIQVFYNKSGEAKYARARVYSGCLTKGEEIKPIWQNATAYPSGLRNFNSL
jgi:hypothetical protein